MVTGWEEIGEYVSYPRFLMECTRVGGSVINDGYRLVATHLYLLTYIFLLVHLRCKNVYIDVCREVCSNPKVPWPDL